ncbi:MAG TPA: methylated-DNA--[protein]-cysteine S-methyltransferase [Thermodesulfobacteriota bacterium]|nr:methylated-DNA--[protein]-cysteine S-methyltransferase [Thermodesulfobacteriota bacterium]
MSNIYYTSFSTSIGRTYLAATEKGICKVSLGYKNEKEFVRELRSLDSEVRTIVKSDLHLTGIKNDILKYLSGEAVSFRRHALAIDGTDFQKKVWAVLSHIPYGRVLTYKQVAEKIGAPNAFRAVGSACGANELPIIIPCHWVVASKGGLGGFSGGLKLKRFLLRLEGQSY